MVSGDTRIDVSDEMSESNIASGNNLDMKVNLTNVSSVGIVGTGNFGKALGSKLETCGVEVIVGSRNPGGKFVSVEKSIQENLIILAVPKFSWTEIPFGKMNPRAVVIDCSNRSLKCPTDELSQAEILQQMVPPLVHVVKGLNTISAYELENKTIPVRKKIPIAGNDKLGKKTVGVLLAKLGYQVCDMGSLEQARTIENIPLSLFPEWRKPIIVSFLIWIFYFLLTFSRYHFFLDNNVGWEPEGLQNIFVKYINRTCNSHALTLLSACYLPGVLAAYTQLVRGTKYSEFPVWLATWLKMRKQLGVLMLVSASVHVCFYVLLYEPHYGVKQIPSPTVNGWDWDTFITVQTQEITPSLRTNLYILAGISAYFSAVVLGIISLPSVSSSLSWNEFRTIQSWLGWICLILSIFHSTLGGFRKFYKFNDSSFRFNDSASVPLILPALTLLLRILLLIPMVDARLTQIRQGKVF